ncbi:MAG: ATPase [Roseibacillus sp.]|nr:ATPase [Roseibacillus sp.]
MPSCCSKPPAEPPESSSCCSSQRRIDWLFWFCLGAVVAACILHLILPESLSESRLGAFAHGAYEMLARMWWGILLGIVAVGFIGMIPRQFITAILGPGGRFSGILRACGAGLLLDLCNHGILLVGMKLYERGASLGQIFAFLIASPWNSLSTTLILISLIGVKWTLAIIGLSAVIGVTTGLITESLVRTGILGPNPNQKDLPSGFRFWSAAKEHYAKAVFNRAFFLKHSKRAVSESRMILRWILLGIVIVATLRALFDPATFSQWFGPTVAGLALTFLAATFIEVCSEGSSPLASDLLTRAGAPGNGFAFLMAGAATDYTEILALRETTKSWKLAFALPLLASPQILIVALILNQPLHC